ncbi:unnamed protein product, partial [marine sediment metagenome]
IRVNGSSRLIINTTWHNFTKIIIEPTCAIEMTPDKGRFN